MKKNNNNNAIFVQIQLYLINKQKIFILCTIFLRNKEKMFMYSLNTQVSENSVLSRYYSVANIKRNKAATIHDYNNLLC